MLKHKYLPVERIFALNSGKRRGSLCYAINHTNCRIEVQIRDKDGFGNRTVALNELQTRKLFVKKTSEK